MNPHTGDVDESTGPTSISKTVLVGYEGEVTATDLFNSADPRSVLDSVKVTAGKFKLKYTANVAADEFAKGDTVEWDNMTVRVRISVQDQAGNSTEQKFGAQNETP